MMFYLGIAYFRQFSGLILASELTPKKYQVWVVSTLLALDNLNLIIVSIWWGYVDKHTMYTFFVPFLLILIFGLGYFWVPESP